MIDKSPLWVSFAASVIDISLGLSAVSRTYCPGRELMGLADFPGMMRYLMHQHARAWFIKGTVYYEIPLLNYVGWFVLMSLAPLGWILIARRRDWCYRMKGLISIVALLPLSVAAIALSLLLNGIVGALGFQ